MFRPPLHWCSPLAPGRAPATGPGPPVGSGTSGHQTLAPRRAEPGRAEPGRAGPSRAAPGRAGTGHVPPAERSLLHTGDRPWGRSRVCSCQAGGCALHVKMLLWRSPLLVTCDVPEESAIAVLTRRPMNRAVPRNG